MSTSVSPNLSTTQPLGRTETIVEERTEYRYEEGDHERFSHYVPKDKLTEAMVMGTPVVALCGKVWVPSRNPDRFPVCPQCKELWQSMKPGGDDGKGGDKGSDGQ
ncbi:DUF3039 domain-containing protein [Granulicoccus phenolivorans]|uniref:DUF3039 domain-containing protein n=1 Tax=Granulicoccus phenolivorans TaxID=266854 RepID=UPI00041D6426|nr:DUF3039 domain-containing protein [Granulicoccus phenolivorans]